MRSLKRLIHHLKPYWRGLAVTTVFILLQTGLGLLPPLFQREIVDGVIEARQAERLLPLVLGLIGVYALTGLTDAGDQYLRHTIGERILYDLRIRIYNHLQRLSLAFFERTSTGELMSRVSNDVSALEQFITHGTILTLVAAVRLAGAAIVLFVLEPRLALVALLPVPLIAFGLRRFNRRVRPLYRRVRDRLGDVNARLQDDLAGMRVIQAFGQEDAELDRFSQVSGRYLDARVASIGTWATFFPVLGFLSALGGALVLGVGAGMVLRGELTLGTLVAFVSYIASFYEPIRRLTDIDNILQQAIAAAERIFELLDAEPDIYDAPGAVALSHMAGEITFEDVHFSYDSGDEVLHDVDFHVAPGEVVALVGPSGAGKTSIANLLCRFYDPTHGRVLVDGHDLREVQIASLRQHVSVVLQDTFLFNATVRENLIYGRPDASDEAIEAAARAAYAHEFITALPQGYETVVGERGVKLSGGQRQRLALARAFLTDPRILILDDSTSAIDSATEDHIQRAIYAAARGRTTFIITHRLSQIRWADLILVVRRGRLVASGSHEDLLRESEAYRRIFSE